MKDLTPFLGKLHRGTRRSVLLNEEQRQWFAAAILEYPIEYIGKKMGVCYMTVARLIDTLGLPRGRRFNGSQIFYKIHPEELQKRNEKIRQKRMKLIKREKFNLRMGAAPGDQRLCEHQQYVEHAVYTAGKTKTRRLHRATDGALHERRPDGVLLRRAHQAAPYDGAAHGGGRLQLQAIVEQDRRPGSTVAHGAPAARLDAVKAVNLTTMFAILIDSLSRYVLNV